MTPTHTHLGHVQPGLSNGQLKDGPGSVHVPQDGLQLGELDPGGAVLRIELQVLLVQLPAAVELTQLQLQFDVALQKFVLGAFTDGQALSTDMTFNLS